MTHHDIPQYSAEWFRARIGIPTASAFDKLLTPKTLKLSSQAEAYQHRLLAEWLLQTPFETETHVWAMDVGMGREEEAVQYYELTTGQETQVVGFCTTDDGRVGCSPDRFVGEEGLLEVKCPLAPTQVRYLLAGTLPAEYLLQTQGQLYVTGRAWCDFLSYYPGMPAVLVRVLPETAVQQALQTVLTQFCEELEKNKVCLSGSPFPR